MQGLVTFPGVDHILRASYTMGHGIVPGVCVIEMAPQADTFADVGTLTFEYGDDSVVLPGCKADRATARLNEDGLVWQVSILDRRWKWTFGEVWGDFNARDDGGQLWAGLVATPQDLATYLLTAAGESGFDVSQLPNDTRPHVEWVGANPMTELERLCHALSCRVVLHLDNTVSIEQLGLGATLPALPSIMESSLNIDPPIQPDSIVVFGDRTIFQTRIPLEAVGKDIDDSIVPIDDLTYAPADGWGVEPACMSNVPEADGARQRALDTVFRWYRLKIDASTPLAIAPLEASLIDRALVLPLLGELAAWTTDADGRRLTGQPAVYGIYSPHAIPSNETNGLPHNSDEFDEFAYKGSFSLDLARGLVMFAQPVKQFSDTTDGWLPADLWLECAFHVRDPASGAHFRWKQDAALPGDPQGTGPETIEQIDDLQARYRMVPTTLSSGNPAGVTTTWEDNVTSDALVARSQDILDAAVLRYTQPEAATVVTYAELVPVDLDGAIQQVTYRVDERGTVTTAGRNAEHDAFVPVYNKRRQPRSERAARRALRAATRELSRDARRRAHSGGSASASSNSNAPWVEFVNVSGETIPAHAAMRASGMTSVDGRGVLEMDKPDSSHAQAVYFNGPVDVADEAYGLCTRTVPLVALYDTGEGTPDAGDALELVADSWTMAARPLGPFVVQGVLDDDEGLALIGRPDIAVSQPTGLVRVLNNSGGDVSKFGVLVIDSPYYDPTDAGELEDFSKAPPAVIGVTPDENEPRHFGRFCVAQEDIAEDEWGIAMVSGITPVQIYVNTDPTVDRADINDAVVSRLRSDPARLAGSALILWKEDWATYDDVVWALVRLSNPTEPPPGCGEKPLLDRFDDDDSVTLDNHIMDRGCGWLPITGVLTEYVIQSNQLEASTGTSTGAYTPAATAASTVVLDFHMGTSDDLQVEAILRLLSTNTYWQAQARAKGGTISTLRLIERTGGTTTVRVDNTGLTMPFNTDYQLTLSDSGVGLILSLTGGVSSSGSFGSGLHGNGKGVGFRTASNSGTYSVTTKLKKWQCT